MAIASASNSYILVGAEATYGTAPTTTTGAKYLRYTGESLAYTAETTASEEIRGDRNVSDTVRTAVGVEGDIEFEFSYGTMDGLLEGLFQSSWSASTLINGTTLSSYSIEKGFSTQTSGVANEFFVFTGCVPNTMSLTLETGSIVTGTMGLVGKAQTTYSGAALAGFNNVVTSPVAATTSDVFNAVSMLTLTEGGSAIGNVQSMSFDVDNALRQQRIIGSTSLAGIGSGNFSVTGTLVTYMDSMTLYNKFLNETASSIVAVLDDGTNTYTITFPNVKYTTATVLAGSVDDDVIVELEWQALYHTATGGTAKIVYT
jgi:hypothetical protein